MELPGVGVHCSVSSCKRLDFLPLTCGCHKKFCAEHFGKHAFECQSIQNQKEFEKNEASKVFMCSHVGCTVTSLVPLFCDKCRKHSCISHRHINGCIEKDAVTTAKEKERYEAPVECYKRAKAVAEKQIDDALNKAKAKEKNRAIVRKIQILQLKNKATGCKAIPAADRIYFNITYARKTGSKPFPVFVSKTWTVGKAIDAIAQELGLVNNNNKFVELKLRLFKKDTGDIISRNTADLLDKLLATDTIYNGEDLVFEYVNESCIKIGLE